MRARRGLLCVCLLTALACDDGATTPGPTGPPGGQETGEGFEPSAPDARFARLVPGEARPVPDGLRECAGCHARTVASFLGHGMSDSLGPLTATPRATQVNPRSGQRYELGPDRSGAPGLVAIAADGGRREQRLVGRLGAGLFDVSFVGTELAPDGSSTGRLSFLPVEWIRGHGPALSPFELSDTPVGLDMPVNARCLECHTDTDPATLPAAARASGTAPSPRIWPENLLGSDAFKHLEALTCDACHGDTRRHADLMAERATRDGKELGLPSLALLPAGTQRDVCARCHLQGDGQLDLAPLPRGGPQPDDFLARRPVLVPARPGTDFRFVGQTQRLALSACFQGTPAMTCTTCHDPHISSRLEDFEARCLACHEPVDCVRPGELSVHHVTGAAPRTTTACVDCHVRRSQPFDLPHVRTADHFVRRHIERPDTPDYRATEDPGGPLRVFHDGRLGAALATEAGRRWEDGVVALGLFQAGRLDEAAERLSGFPAPGSPGATTPSTRDTGTATTAPLPPLETSADFHHVRGLVLEATGETAAALEAYGDALRRDPGHPQARLNRAQLLLSTGRVADAMRDADQLVTLYPLAEKPWNLRAVAAAGAGMLPGAVAALEASAALWPSDPAIWHQLARLQDQLGDPVAASFARDRARVLAPGLEQDP